jgi:hypothetical protein
MQADEDNTGLLKNLDNIGDYIEKKDSLLRFRRKLLLFSKLFYFFIWILITEFLV